jgi:hypothetical protein
MSNSWSETMSEILVYFMGDRGIAASIVRTVVVTFIVIFITFLTHKLSKEVSNFENPQIAQTTRRT